MKQPREALRQENTWGKRDSTLNQCGNVFSRRPHELHVLSAVCPRLLLTARPGSTLVTWSNRRKQFLASQRSRAHLGDDHASSVVGQNRGFFD